MNLLDLKPTFLSLPIEKKRSLLEKIRASRFVVKKATRSTSTTKKRKKADLSALSTTELQTLINQLKAEMENLETEERK